MSRSSGRDFGLWAVLSEAPPTEANGRRVRAFLLDRDRLRQVPGLVDVVAAERRQAVNIYVEPAVNLDSELAIATATRRMGAVSASRRERSPLLPLVVLGHTHIDTTQIHTRIRPTELQCAVAFYGPHASRMLTG